MSGGYTSLDTEHFLSRMFGKRHTHGLANSLVEGPTWTRYRRKLIDALERYIAANVVFTDAAHRDNARRVVAWLRANAASPTATLREQALVTGLVELCLILLGDPPSHWDRKVVNKPHHYELDRHRTLYYSQSVKQRARLIVDACQRHRLLPEMKEETAKQVREQYWRMAQRRKHADFVDWFRENFPEQYVALFAW